MSFAGKTRMVLRFSWTVKALSTSGMQWKNTCGMWGMKPPRSTDVSQGAVIRREWTQVITVAHCSHCGQDTGITYGTVTMGVFTAILCHTGDPDRPDCYRRVTVYHEPLGALLKHIALPRGVDYILDQGLEAVKFLTQFGEEFPTENTVCVTHKRFVPCRKTDGMCLFSSTEESVEEVRKYQAGE
jgi:hypothetical protein